MKKIEVIVAISVVTLFLVGATLLSLVILGDYRLTTTNEGTYVTKMYCSDEVKESAELHKGDGHYMTQYVCVYRDNGQIIRKVWEHEYPTVTDNTYDYEFTVVYDPKVAGLSNNLLSSNPLLKPVLDDYAKGGGK